MSDISIEHLQFSCDTRNFNLKMVHVLVSPKLLLPMFNIAAVAGLIKRDARFTVNTIAHSAGISSGSVHIILTQQLNLTKQKGLLI